MVDIAEAGLPHSARLLDVTSQELEDPRARLRLFDRVEIAVGGQVEDAVGGDRGGEHLVGKRDLVEHLQFSAGGQDPEFFFRLFPTKTRPSATRVEPQMFSACLVAPLKPTGLGIQAVDCPRVVGQVDEAVGNGRGGQAVAHVVETPAERLAGDVATAGHVDCGKPASVLADPGVVGEGHVERVADEDGRGENGEGRAAPSGLKGTGGSCLGLGLAVEFPDRLHDAHLA